MKMKFTAAGVVLITASIWTPYSDAFTFVLGYKTPVQNNRLTFHVDVPHAASQGSFFNDAFNHAAGQWSLLGPVQIDTVRQQLDPCRVRTELVVGGVGFTPNLCGFSQSVGVRTAAYASPLFTSSKQIVSGDIAFSSGFTWDVYSGPGRGETKYDAQGAPYMAAVPDFRRMSLHEIGHVLGLGHSIFSRSALAIPVVAEELTPDDICGVNIANGNPAGCPLLLKHPLAASGKQTSAVFVGGASKDQGRTYQQVFQTTDVLNVMATAVVEDPHYGKPGRLHAVIELSDGTTLMTTDTGFAPWDGSVSALRAATSLRTLSGANEIHVLKDFDLKANQVANIGVAVYVGYSLDSEPGEVYYSGMPIQFRVE